MKICKFIFNLHYSIRKKYSSKKVFLNQTLIQTNTPEKNDWHFSYYCERPRRSFVLTKDKTVETFRTSI